MGSANSGKIPRPIRVVPARHAVPGRAGSEIVPESRERPNRLEGLTLRTFTLTQQPWSRFARKRPAARSSLLPRRHYHGANTASCRTRWRE